MNGEEIKWMDKGDNTGWSIGAWWNSENTTWMNREKERKRNRWKGEKGSKMNLEQREGIKEDMHGYWRDSNRGKRWNEK